MGRRTKLTVDAAMAELHARLNEQTAGDREIAAPPGHEPTRRVYRAPIDDAMMKRIEARVRRARKGR